MTHASDPPPISARLRAVARACLHGARVADVGADHARLGEYLIRSGVARSVICTDLNDAPVRKARARMEGVGAQAGVRQGDGLDPILPGEVDVVCIAGMSGRLMVDILQRGEAALTHVSRLILQPLCHEGDLREWLMRQSWRVLAERMAEERGRQYDTIVAAQGDGMAPYKDGDLRAKLEMGPFLSARPDGAFRRKWERKLEHLRIVLAGREGSGDDTGAAAVRGEISRVEVVLGPGT